MCCEFVAEKRLEALKEGCGRWAGRKRRGQTGGNHAGLGWMQVRSGDGRALTCLGGAPTACEQLRPWDTVQLHMHAMGMLVNQVDCAL